MNYRRVYGLLMTRARGRTLNGYSEAHHILPRALGGSDDPANIARLTAREHFIAHWLLARLHGGRMWVAMLRMKGRRGTYTNSRGYAEARAEWASWLRINQRGERNHAYGKPLSAEHARKVSEAMKRRRLSAEHRAKIGAAHRGRPVSDETRAKQSASRKGKYSGANNPMFGKKRPDLAERNRQRTAR